MEISHYAATFLITLDHTRFVDNDNSPQDDILQIESICRSGFKDVILGCELIIVSDDILHMELRSGIHLEDVILRHRCQCNLGSMGPYKAFFIFFSFYKAAVPNGAKKPNQFFRASHIP